MRSLEVILLELTAKDECWALVLPVFCSGAVSTKVLSQTVVKKKTLRNEFLAVNLSCIHSHALRSIWDESSGFGLK